MFQRMSKSKAIHPMPKGDGFSGLTLYKGTGQHLRLLKLRDDEDCPFAALGSVSECGGSRRPAREGLRAEQALLATCVRPSHASRI
jgi:hypothetical protein